MQGVEVMSITNWLSWLEVVKVAGAVLLILALVIEFAADRISSPLTSRIDAARDQQISQLNHDTTRLSDHMAFVREEMAKAKADAERAYAIAAAATERAARLEAVFAPVQVRPVGMSGSSARPN
jgi:ABC-type transport system involved in cytochrome bd biosynthesis fused ATPase/permease subunit